MQDFDIQREERYKADREFKIGGEVFVRKAAVRPEVLNAYEDLEPGHSAADTIKVVDDLILAFLEPENDAHERYRALRKREEDPISGRDMNNLVLWLVRESTARPTSQPSPSPNGQGTTRTNSTDGSSLEQDEVSAV